MLLGVMPVIRTIQLHASRVVTYLPFDIVNMSHH
jgi:hypothetical protein